MKQIKTKHFNTDSFIKLIKTRDKLLTSLEEYIQDVLDVNCYVKATIEDDILQLYIEVQHYGTPNYQTKELKLANTITISLIVDGSDKKEATQIKKDAIKAIREYYVVE